MKIAKQIRSLAHAQQTELEQEDLYLKINVTPTNPSRAQPPSAGTESIENIITKQQT